MILQRVTSNEWIPTNNEWKVTPPLKAQIYSALSLILHNKRIKNSWVIHEEINPKTCETLLEREENICTWTQLTTYFHVIHSLLINMILGLMKETIRNLNKKSKDLFSKFENCMSYLFFFFLVVYLKPCVRWP